MDEHIRPSSLSMPMSERLSQEFKQDPLFKLIVKLDLVEYLFDDYIENLKEGADYTTTDFEEWYCTHEQAINFLCKPSTMRSWQKQLNHYIEARMSGRTVIMDYQAVFRLKMALLLRKHHNIKLSRCAELVGIVSADAFRIIDRDDYDDEPRRDTNLADPFAGASEEQIQKLTEWMNALIDKRLEEKMLMLPGDSRIDEMQEKIAETMNALQSMASDEKQKELIDHAVNTMRQDVEVRDRVLMEQLNQRLEDKQLRQEMKQEIINSLPFFVRWFIKK
jgi:hypothetical protein